MRSFISFATSTKRVACAADMLYMARRSPPIPTSSRIFCVYSTRLRALQVAGQVVTITLHTSRNIHTIRTTLEGLQQIDNINLPGTGRILQS